LETLSRVWLNNCLFLWRRSLYPIGNPFNKRKTVQKNFGLKKLMKQKHSTQKLGNTDSSSMQFNVNTQDMKGSKLSLRLQLVLQGALYSEFNGHSHCDGPELLTGNAANKQTNKHENQESKPQKMKHTKPRNV
jgi:hypothetical protein